MTKETRSGVPAGEPAAIDVVNERRRVARARLTGKRPDEVTSWARRLDTMSDDELVHQIALRTPAPAGSPASEARGMFAQELVDRHGRHGAYLAAFVDEQPSALRHFVEVFGPGGMAGRAAVAELKRRGLEVPR